MSFKEFFVRPFLHYMPEIEQKILESIPSLGPKSELRDACEYALCNGGKRIRPAIVFMIAKALNRGEDATYAALAVEYFHTASLIADDLPCMDNDDQRRDVPSLHKAYNEAVALLATYALISSGYEKIALNAKKDTVLSQAIMIASKTTGILGATGGQYLDLFPPLATAEALKETLQKKTGALFELSFAFGWLFGGGEIEKLSLVKKAAQHFGTAFQILDDFHDLSEDVLSFRKINAPAILGKERAYQCLQEEAEAFCKTIESLSLHLPELTSLVAMFPKFVTYLTH